MSTFLLCLVAAVSPVIFLNSSSVLGRAGLPAVIRFCAGNLAVLLVLGFASLGLLGSSAASAAEREIASKAVDRFLGVLLLAYGIFLLVQHLRHHDHPPQTEKPRDRGEFAFGVLSMATNFTTLPIFMSVGQRIGALSYPLFVQCLLLIGAAVIVACPAWLPAVLARFTSGRGSGVVSAGLRRRISAATQWISILACLIGSAFLILHGV